MSEEFDKEAEREKLREKYERDRKKREHTQHMSELLLKGATMTNSHCDACGDPIFRHDGREFCPTCARQDGEGGTGGGSTNDAADAAATDGSASDVTPEAELEAGAETEIDGESNGTANTSTNAAADTTAAENRTASGRATPPERATAGTPERTTAGTPERTAAGTPDDPDTSGADTRSDPSATRRTETDARPAAERTGSNPSEDLRAARESLSRTVRRFAEAAERSDGPRRARDNLEAAREAAEALSALDR